MLGLINHSGVPLQDNYVKSTICLQVAAWDPIFLGFALQVFL